MQATRLAERVVPAHFANFARLLDGEPDLLNLLDVLFEPPELHLGKPHAFLLDALRQQLLGGSGFRISYEN